MKTKICNFLIADNTIAATSGTAVSSTYLYLTGLSNEIWVMNILAFLLLCLKTAVLATIGGACGVMGKNLLTKIKKKK